MTDDIYLSRKEAAALLGIQPDTLIRWTRTTTIPHRRISDRVFVFPRAELHAWIEAKHRNYVTGTVEETQRTQETTARRTRGKVLSMRRR